MKVLYVTTVSSTVNAFLIPHIRILTEQGHSVGVTFNLLGKIHQELNKLGCKVHHIGFQRNPIKKENFNAYKSKKK